MTGPSVPVEGREEALLGVSEGTPPAGVVDRRNDDDASVVVVVVQTPDPPSPDRSEGR